MAGIKSSQFSLRSVLSTHGLYAGDYVSRGSTGRCYYVDLDRSDSGPGDAIYLVAYFAYRGVLEGPRAEVELTSEEAAAVAWQLYELPEVWTVELLQAVAWAKGGGRAPLMAEAA